MALISRTLADSGRAPLETSTNPGQANYPVFGDTSGMPDPNQYSQAINGAFSNFASQLGSAWSELKSMNAPGATAPQAEGSPIMEFDEAAQGGSLQSSAPSGPDPSAWYTNPWQNMGAKNEMNPFQRTMGGLATSRMKKSGLF